MKSSALSTPSTLESSSNSREDAPPNKRARGRPLKGVGQSTIPEERRQQVRNAQIAFRKRKQEAMKSLEQRAEILEDAVEEISKAFLEFSDSMLKTQLVQRDPAIGRNLHSTTAKIIELAKIANGSSHSSYDTSSEQGEDNASKPRERSIALPNPLPPSTPNDAHQQPKDISSLNNLFGNGWFSYEPAFITETRSSPQNAGLEIPPSGFVLKLITQSLQVAYFALLDEKVSYSPILAQMFQYAFLYHSREEILANLRWFLEHGILAQRHLGRAVFGFDSTLSLQRFDFGHGHEGFKPRVLHPLVDAQALLDADYRCPCPVAPFLNAFDVEEFLVKEGAFHIGDEVIYMQTEKIGDGKYLGGSMTENVSGETTGWEQNEAMISTNVGDFHHRVPWTSTDTAILPSNLTVISGNSPTNSCRTHCELFDFNALLKDKNDQSIIQEVVLTDTGDRNEPSSKIVSLSVPILLDNLIRNSVCLGTGPGYPRDSIHVAITASTHSSTLDS